MPSLSPGEEAAVAADLDPVIHAPARLRLMVVLTELPPGSTMSFARLQELLGLTAGNLITHLRRLDDAGYVRTRKEGRLTTAQATDQGRAAFATYRAALAALLGD
ncbi:transcriptional regulator [Piscicoccus intestinalis]|uniref:transcriptional regulator n=1 Tax=Piscicoccus intestinalis TaxID=746033 RepID=UPI000838D622|nr:transcriptional regulator [Piscicoccus intestinalis]